MSNQGKQASEEAQVKKDLEEKSEDYESGRKGGQAESADESSSNLNSGEKNSEESS